MFRLFLIGSLLLSLLICGAADLIARRKIDERRHQLVEKQRELQKVGPIVDEVLAYQNQKDKLQARIDVINQLKQNQKGVYGALRAISALGSDGASIESIAIADPHTLIILGHAKSPADIDRLAAHFPTAGKRTNADKAFELRGTVP
jgi:hypothetical protein